MVDLLKGLTGHKLTPERLAQVKYEQGLEYAKQFFARLANASIAQESDRRINGPATPIVDPDATGV